jgi:hypothetical protein
MSPSVCFSDWHFSICAVSGPALKLTPQLTDHVAEAAVARFLILLGV